MTVENSEAKNARARFMVTVPDKIPKNEVTPTEAACLIATGKYELKNNEYVLKDTVVPPSSAEEFEILRCLKLPNGIRQVLVSINADQALLDVYFFNKNLFNKILSDSSDPHDIFPIKGGGRLPAGPKENQVMVTGINPVVNPNEAILRLTVTPIGDYSTYTLSINRELKNGKFARFDPLFRRIEFKFRPGCFSLDCAPEFKSAPKPKENPKIDYLAKDFDSFRHTMIAAMMERVPNWQSTSEADLDQVLIELLSASADELSDHQDRVMNEAYLSTARKRVSLARHARLMDYHIHQGNQASTWLTLELKNGEVVAVPDRFAVWCGNQNLFPSSKIFLTKENKKKIDLFSLDVQYISDLNSGNLPPEVKETFNNHGLSLSSSVDILILGSGKWDIRDNHYSRTYRVKKIKRRLHVEVPKQLHYLLNRLELYTWENSIRALDAGSTRADLRLPKGVVPISQMRRAAHTLQNLFCEGNVEYLLLQEWRHPGDGSEAGRDPEKRQVVKLLKGRHAAEAAKDPLTDEWMVRVRWEERDRLKKRYCFSIDGPDGNRSDVSLFHGNLVKAHHGWPGKAEFVSPEKMSGNAKIAFEATGLWGTICGLPDRPLAYNNTPPGGEHAPQSTLSVKVHTSAGNEDWEEVITLVNSRGVDEHFAVETDEFGNSRIRFGNGTNGKMLSEDSVVTCRYQIGNGQDGNIGADTLKYFDLKAEYVTKVDPQILTLLDQTAYQSIQTCWNPFDVTSGREPEPVEEIIRRVPEAYRFRQLRAVTLKDYEDRAEEIPEVFRAKARYMWTGSWRTVRIAIDPVGTTKLSEKLSGKIHSHLNAVRLIGEDLEIRPARYVPVKIEASLCIHPDYWKEDVTHILMQEFSDGYTSDGRMGFFHPDLWSFGQPLRVSEIIGRIQTVKGVDHVIGISLKRWQEEIPGTNGILEVRPHEIILVKNNPDSMEQGFIFIDVRGGRR